MIFLYIIFFLSGQTNALKLKLNSNECNKLIKITLTKSFINLLMEWEIPEPLSIRPC